ncbi:MAG TPA: NAD(P)H-dependent glycerol-3-phosphate dehydrogenase, partial [Rhizomicrobium sp.]|nr:NAD(P)H-dependent glycerol-3-phosphate dehydrogenase [Rhizomicrobium sp.]
AEPYSRIAILGGGAWGTALAVAAHAAGRTTSLWAREEDVVTTIAREHENKRFLAGVHLPKEILATGDLSKAVEADALLLTAPAQVLGEFARVLKPLVASGTPLVICAKGIEKNTGRLVHEIVADALPHAACAILSGPSFAREVALGQPTAVTIAAEDPIAARLQASLSAPFFRPYASDDVVGVALGGAAKNVYAIACGVVEGMGLGENARAALLARSFAELTRLGEALGAKRETLMGLSGLGDLVLTATSKSSRNFSFGVSLGQGKTLAELEAPVHPLAEGVATAPALVQRARAFKIELPIAEAMADLLKGELQLSEALTRLMSRRLKSE